MMISIQLLMRVNKLMRERCNKPSFWKPIFERHHLIYPFSVSYHLF